MNWLNIEIAPRQVKHGYATLLYPAPLERLFCFAIITGLCRYIDSYLKHHYRWLKLFI
jgi:hypothetical protein